MTVNLEQLGHTSKNTQTYTNLPCKDRGENITFRRSISWVPELSLYNFRLWWGLWVEYFCWIRAITQVLTPLFQAYRVKVYWIYVDNGFWLNLKCKQFYNGRRIEKSNSKTTWPQRNITHWCGHIKHWLCSKPAQIFGWKMDKLQRARFAQNPTHRLLFAFRHFWSDISRRFSFSVVLFGSK